MHREVRVFREGEGPGVAFAALLVPISMFVGIALVIIVALALGHQSRVARYRVIEKALAEGKEIPPYLLEEPRRRNPVAGGLVLIATGLGLSIALGLAARPVQAVWGLIPLLIGIALLVAIPLRKRLNANGD
jgi:hypothetical protein